MRKINSIIRDYMDDKGVTVTKLSQQTRIGRVNLGYKLKGKREMSVYELMKIVDALGITEKDLFKGLKL